MCISTSEVDLKKKPQQVVAIIASVLDNKERLLVLWSQLECFYSHDTQYCDQITISASTYAKDNNILKLCINAAVQNIPHLREKQVSIQYIVNDLYDVDLCCDVLLSIRLFQISRMVVK